MSPRATSPSPGRRWPGGHEGAGIVEEVGPNTAGWSVGDHVVLSFLPACGLCQVVRVGDAEPV